MGIMFEMPILGAGYAGVPGDRAGIGTMVGIATAVGIGAMAGITGRALGADMPLIATSLARIIRRSTSGSASIIIGASISSNPSGITTARTGGTVGTEATAVMVIIDSFVSRT